MESILCLAKERKTQISQMFSISLLLCLHSAALAVVGVAPNISIYTIEIEHTTKFSNFLFHKKKNCECRENPKSTRTRDLIVIYFMA